MNTIRSIASLVAMAALTIGVAGAAGTPAPTAQRPAMAHRGGFDGAGMEGGPGFRFHRVLESLDLSADQQARIKAIFEQARPRLQALHESGHANREQLATTPPTDPGYAGMVAQAKVHAGDLIEATSELWTQVYGVLTPAQREQIPNIVAAEQSRRDARREEWKQRRSAQ
jgi:Spy/CpxP family protein refolding chaperone